MLNEPEPLPYVQPRRRVPVVGPAEIEPTTRLRTAGRRGTQDLGLLLLRPGSGRC